MSDIQIPQIEMPDDKSHINYFFISRSTGEIEQDDKDVDKYEQKHQMGDEFLTLLLGIIMERNNPAIGMTFINDVTHMTFFVLFLGLALQI